MLGITFSIYGGSQIVAHADTGNTTDHVSENASDAKTLADQSQVTLKSAGQSTNGLDESQNGSASKNVAAEEQTTAINGNKNSTDVTQDGGKNVANADSNADQSEINENSATSGKGSTTLILKKGSNVSNAEVFKTSLVQTTAATDDNTVTVTDAKGLVDAIQNGTATTINIANNISLGDLKRGGNAGEHGDRIKNKRDIVIQSADNNKYIVDFNNYAFTMNDQSHSVTFKNLDLYSRSWFGLIQSAGTYNFDNINYHGPQMIYSKVDSVINYSGTVNAETVNNYTYDGKSYTTQQAQEIIEFRGGRKGTVNFAKNSNVTLSTVNGMVMYLEGTGSSINVADGATVNINPHYTGGAGEFYYGVHGIGIYVRNGADINVNPGGKLIINTEKGANDKEVSGGIYLDGNSTINVQNGGNLTFNSDGQLSSGKARNPLTVSGAAKINVGNNGMLSVNATNLGNYSGSLMNIGGTSNVNLAAHSNFNVTGDGTGAITAIQLANGSTFTSDQPGEFNIDLSKNTNTGKTLIKNGTINFTRVKTKLADGTESAPIKSIKITFGADGKPTVNSVVGPNKTGVDAVLKVLNDPAKYTSDAFFTASGQDVDITKHNLTKDNVTGTVTSKDVNGKVDDGDILVNIIIHRANGTTENVTGDNIPVEEYDSATGKTKTINYTAKTKADGSFDVVLSNYNLSKGDSVEIQATKNYIDATPVTINYVDKTALQDAVNEAPTVNSSDLFKNADSSLQNDYTKTIAAGQSDLDSDEVTQDQVDTAVANIETAKSKLNGMANPTDNKLDTTTDSKTGTKTTTLTGKAEAGSTVTAKKSDGTVIGTAQVGDDGTYSIVIPQADINGTDIKVSATKDGKKSGEVTVPTSADKTALTNDVKGQDATHKDPSYINGDPAAKDAYDKAVSDGQKVLDNANASQAEVDQAAKAIEDAKGNLKGEATNKDALKSAIDDQPTTQGSAKYKNSSDKSQKAYNDAVAAGQKVYDNPTASQTDVDNAKKVIDDAKAALDGKDTDKTALTNDVKGQDATHKDPSYINGDPAAKDAYDKAVSDGQKVLDNANASQAEVDQDAKAIEDAKGNLDGIANLHHSQAVAKSNLNDAAEKAKQSIDAQPSLTPEQKQAAKDDVDKAAKTANDAIDKATTTDDVDKATNDGLTNIDKAAAKAAVQNALNEKTTEINDASLTKDEQAAFEQKAQKFADDAFAAIDSAKDVSNVDASRDEGINNIKGIIVPANTGNNQQEPNINVNNSQNTADQSNGNVAISNSDQKTDQLPQTGNEAGNEYGIIGLAIASLVGLFSLGKRNKKED